MHAPLPDQPRPERIRIGDGRREPDRLQARRQRPEPRQAERQEIATLVGDERVEFVEDDGVEVGEKARRVGGGQEERCLLRRRQQDVGGFQLLPLALGDRRVAGARFKFHRQPHLRHRRFKVPGNIDRERLQRRDVERVDAAPAERSVLRPFVEGDQRRQETGESLPGSGRRDQQRRPPGPGLCQQFELVRARRPAFRGKPCRERRGQERRGRLDDGAGGHRLRGSASVGSLSNGPERVY